MHTPPTPLRASIDLETPLGRVEQQLSELQAALRADDVHALESAATGLHRALASAVDLFRVAARRGTVPRSMRERLAVAGARVAAQREALARATASLDQAIEVLLPSQAATYQASGVASRPTSRGALVA